MSLLTAAPVVAASHPAAATARPGGSAPGPATGTVHAVRRPAQQAAGAFSTPARRQRQHPNPDFALRTVVAPGHPGRLIQRVTGGLWLGIGRGYAHWIRLIGYSNAVSDPVRCANHSLEFRPGQMVFYCHGYRDGT